MALVVNHNLGSERALGLLEKNQTALGKSLKAAASGAKINGASDGASEYAISRRLEIEEFGLGQDIANVKTGGDILAVAEGGIQQVIENLRDMKKLAINAANDTNTDADRATIEKEFASRMETITDIAATTNYNGKLLLAGDYHREYTRLERTSFVSGSTGSLRKLNMSDAFSNWTGSGPAPQSTINLSHNVPVTRFTSSAGTNYGNSYAVGIDFTSVTKNVSDLDNNAFAILCGACDQYINIRFDSTKSTTSYGPVKPGARNTEYVIGTAGISSVADIPKAIFDGIGSVPTGASTGNQIRRSPDEYSNPDASDSKIIDWYHRLRISESGGKYFIEKESGYPLDIFNGILDPKPIPNPIVKIVEKFYPGNPLVIHDTTHASNAIHVFIDSMHPRAITGRVPERDPITWEIKAKKNPQTGEILKDNDGNPIPEKYIEPDPKLEDAHVRTREEALRATDILDMALNYALDQITDIGAYRSRLEQDEDKIAIQQESAIGSKSTIQDADMAATMTDFTKYNVLTQAAQLMLAQSNQNASRVLSLLQ